MVNRFLCIFRRSRFTTKVGGFGYFPYFPRQTEKKATFSKFGVMGDGVPKVAPKTPRLDSGLGLKFGRWSCLNSVAEAGPPVTLYPIASSNRTTFHASHRYCAVSSRNFQGPIAPRFVALAIHTRATVYGWQQEALHQRQS